MIDYLQKVMLIGFCAVIASAFFSAPAMAKDRKYHRMKTSDIITIPATAKAPSSNEFRTVTEAQAKELQAKTTEPTAEKKGKHEKYHEMGVTRIVYLRTKPDKGYQTEAEYLKSKKAEEAKPKSQ